MALLRLVRECDLFRKLPEGRHETEAAPQPVPVLVLRWLSFAIICCLGMYETVSFLTPERKQRFDIDIGETFAGHDLHRKMTAMGQTIEKVPGAAPVNIDAVVHMMQPGAPKKMRVLLDVTIFGFPCIDLSLDYQDVMGTRAVDVRSTIFKQRLYQNGTAVDVEHMQNDPKTTDKTGPGAGHGNNTNSSCKTCYGALPDGECCNSCSDVLYAYRLKRWALPRIEDIEQCRHDGTAKSAYQPPQIIHLGDYSSEDYIPKFSKLNHLSASAREPRITTPFKMDMSRFPLKPLQSIVPRNDWIKHDSPFVLNFSRLDLDDDLDDLGFDDDLDADKKAPAKVLKWPSCVQRNIIIHGYDIGEALMIDLSKHGAKTGCWNDDCTETDKFTCESMEVCAEMCQKVDACKWWTWGDEDKVKKCWIRTGRHGREKRYGFSSGARGCVNNATSSPESEVKAIMDSIPDAKDVKAVDTKAVDAKAVDTKPRRMSSLEDDGAVKTQPRRLMGFEDDFGGGIGGRPLGGMFNFGPNPHMPIFGMGNWGNSVENQKRKEQRGESCRLYGYFDTNKVPGNFHIGTHGTMAPSYLSYFDEPAPAEQNMRHVINRLAFVDVIANKTLVGAEKQPLDGFESPKAFTFQYYITVNPATIQKKKHSPFGGSEGYQFRAGSFVTNELIGPAVFFRFDLDPIRVTYYTETVSFTSWITSMCAVIGGCIAISAMLEQFLEAGFAAALSKE